MLHDGNVGNSRQRNPSQTSSISFQLLCHLWQMTRSRMVLDSACPSGFFLPSSIEANYSIYLKQKHALSLLFLHRAVFCSMYQRTIQPLPGCLL